MTEKQYPTLEEVRAMTVKHGRLTAVEWNASSHGMMACSGVFYNRRIELNSGEITLTYSCKREAQDITEEVYRCDQSTLERLTEIADRENLYAWEELRIDPEKDNRPIVLDYSSSSGITLVTDVSRHSINCDTARFCGGGKVIDEIISIFKECEDKQDNLISRKVTELPKPDWMKTGFMCMGMGVQNKPAPEPEPEPAQTQGEWTYTGGTWTCPKCNGEGNEGKFCANCGEWRPDLAPKGYKAPEPKPAPEPQTQPAFPMMNGMLKAMGLVPDDKPDEQLAALLEKKTTHGRLLSFEYSSWSNGMSMNSHFENSTRLSWNENGEPVVIKRLQQGSLDAAVSEYKASEKVVADLEKYIRENNLTNLTEVKYDRSKDPFANVTDTSGGSHYSIVFDESSVGGNSFVAFTLDPLAISQHGGAEIDSHLRALSDMLCMASTLIRSYTEPQKLFGMSGFMGMAGLMGMTPPTEKWTCSECGYEGNSGKYCKNCGTPKPEKQK